MIISFTSPPALYSASRSRVNVNEGEDRKCDNNNSRRIHYFRARLHEVSFFLAVPFSRMIVSRGHGTYVDNDEVVASVAGTIERVNKLVTVRALRTRYPNFRS